MDAPVLDNWSFHSSTTQRQTDCLSRPDKLYRLITCVAPASRQHLEARNDEFCAICRFRYDPNLTHDESSTAPNSARTTPDSSSWLTYLTLRNTAITPPSRLSTSSRLSPTTPDRDPLCASPPIRLSCNHTFGLACILNDVRFRLRHTSSTDPIRCPYCRTPLSPIVPAPALTRAYEAIYTAAARATPTLDLTRSLHPDTVTEVVGQLLRDYGAELGSVAALRGYQRALECMFDVVVVTVPRKRRLCGLFGRGRGRGRGRGGAGRWVRPPERPGEVVRALVEVYEEVEGWRGEVVGAERFFRVVVGRLVDEVYWARGAVVPWAELPAEG